MILFLDRCHNRAAKAYEWMTPENKGNTIWCQTAAEAISVLEDKAYRDKLTKVHLEHDLFNGEYQDPNERTSGMEVIRFLECLGKDRLYHISFNIHSWNPWAGWEMEDRLNKMGLKVTRIPFGNNKEVLN